LDFNPEENKSEAMTCAECGKPILDKESSFCAYCGVSFDSKPISSGLTNEAAILSIVAAVFSVAAGVIGLNYYQSYVTYYTVYGMDTSGSFGFLLFSSFAFVAAAVGFAGGMLALAKKRLKVIVTGMLVMLVSPVFTFVALWHFSYGFLESLLLPEISIIAFSITSIVFIVKSRANFSHA
jgi:hypothetical protein